MLTRFSISISALLFVSLTSTQLYALDFKLFPFDSQLSEAVQSYHQKPDPETVLDRFFQTDIEAIEKEAKKWNNQAHARATLMAFYASIIHQNPQMSLPFAKRIAEETRGAKTAFGLEVIAYGSTTNRDEALGVIARKLSLTPEQLNIYRSFKVYPYPDMEADNGEMLDIHWACFFPTGDEQYVRKIAKPLVHFMVPDKQFKERIRDLAQKKPQPGTSEYKELMEMLTAQAAMFGLTINALKYSMVLESLRKIAFKEHGRVAELAGKIVSEVEKRRKTGSGSAAEGEGVWYNSEGKLIPDADNIKSQDGFDVTLC